MTRDPVTVSVESRDLVNEPRPGEVVMLRSAAAIGKTGRTLRITVTKNAPGT